MNPPKSTMLLVSVFLVFVISCGSVYGITGNFKADSTPYVGVVVLFSDTARHQPIGYCTGFLISPTIMLTAGHSCVGAAAVSVCFDQGPISYSIEGEELIYFTNEPVYDGIPIAYPEYLLGLLSAKNNGDNVFSRSDVGVIVLDEPVGEITMFAQLPEPGIIDSLSAKTPLKAIGYGFQYQITPRNNDPQNSWIGHVSRNSVQVNLVSDNFTWGNKYIRCSASSSQDKGGIAFGDSGGPVLWQASNGQDIVIAVNAYVNSANCNGVTYHTRLDDSQILSWINGFVNQ